MNRDRLIVCVETTIYIHNIRDMHLIHRINETPPNYKGIIALSSSENCLLAFPGTTNNGTVYIFNALTFKNQISITAHDGLIAALEFNSNASLLATASDKGTVIRVFNVSQGTKYAEFRRGLVRNVQISSLSFSLDDQYLVSTSETETVHIFKLEKRNEEVVKHRVRSISTCSTSSANDLADELASANIDQNPSPANIQSTSLAGWSVGLINAVGSILMTGASYLPYQVSDVFQKDRAFATCHIMTGFESTTGATTEAYSSSGSTGTNQPTKLITKKVAAIIYFQSKPHLLTVGSDGLLHIFEIDPINGGEGVQVKTINLLSPNLKTSMFNANIGLAGAINENQTNENAQLPPGMGIITKQAQNPLTTGGTPPKPSMMMPIQKNQISFAQAASNKGGNAKGETRTSTEI